MIAGSVHRRSDMAVFGTEPAIIVGGRLGTGVSGLAARRGRLNL